MENEDVTRESVLNLIDQKNEIEKKIRDMKEILHCNHVGMSEDLVDQDGFPRQDIDVYQVRHARHQIICLQNDHKSLMKQIEEGLHLIHLQTRETQTMDISVPIPKKNIIPFARVNLVEKQSPAEAAGLMEEDLIIEFGTINNDNLKTLLDIGSLVQNSVGHSIPVTVKRDNQTVSVRLTPKKWIGRGLLGCNIIPIENIDR